MGASGKHKHIYNTRQWKRLRVECWARDGGLCRKCGKPVKTSGNRFDPDYYECDHIRPLDEDEGLAFDIDNLQTLHRKCHRGKTSVQQAKRSYFGDVGSDGLPTDANHPWNKER